MSVLMRLGVSTYAVLVLSWLLRTLPAISNMHLPSAAILLLALAVQTSSANHPKLSKRSLATSEPVYPSPWMDPDADGWQEAYAKARKFVSKMTLAEKVNLTTGTGFVCLILQSAMTF